jgi:hypothetical protein
MSADDVVDVSKFVERDERLDAPNPVTPISPSQPTSIQDLQERNSRATSSPIPDRFLDTQPEVETKTPFAESPFWQEYKRRVRQNQDLLILVSDYQNDRGTGKTVLSIDLAERLDRSDEGLTPEKASISPEELINGYTGHPQGSALVLDEAEAGVGAREAMTRINRTLNEIVSMGRVEEKYAILNMPASNHIDKNIIDLAHYWILVQRKGLARVYRLKNNPFEQQKYPTPVQQLSWSDLPNGHDVYQSLTTEKRQRLNNGGGSDERFIPQHEHRAIIEKEREAAEKQVRDDMIWRMIQHPEIDVSQRVIGDIAEMSQSHVYNVKKEREGAQQTPATGD